MLMGDKCSLLVLHGASLTDRLAGGAWHRRSSRVYLTECLPPPDGPAIYGPERGQGQEGRRRRRQEDGWVLSKDEGVLSGGAEGD